jgi:uncharacterized transporter YbjL
MSEGQTSPTTPPGHTLTIVAGLVVLVCLIGAGVGLAFAGWDGGSIMGLLTGITGVAVPLIAAIARLTDLQRATDKQTKTLDKIDHQTNGVLTERIKSAVADAMNEPIGYVPTDTDRP